MNKLLLSNEAIPIAVRDCFKIYRMFRCKVSYNKYYSLNYFIKLIISPFRMCCMKYFTKSFLYYQQENSLSVIFLVPGNVILASNTEGPY